MDENMDDSMQLEGEIDFSAPTPPHEPASTDMFGSPAPEMEHDTFPQSPAASEVSIDFSVATVESQKNKPLPSLEEENEHDHFELFGDSLDLFSVDGKNHNNDVSDMSADEGKKSKETKHKKDKKEKKHRKRESSPKESEEKIVKSTVNEEIEVVKKLESGPTKAELARRSLIELDEDEMEERVERRNRAALEVISKATGHSKLEQHLKLVECREYLRPIYLEDGDLANFVADAIDKANSRSYLNEEPIVSAVKYLEMKSYIADDEWDVEEDPEVKQEKEQTKEATAQPSTNDAASEEAKGSFIELSDSEDEDEEEELEVAPAVPAAPVLSAAELAVQQRALQIQRLKAAAEEKERAELEVRRLRYEASQKVQRSSRTELLTTLRRKVTATALENYCTQSKVKAEDLEKKTKITEMSRLLVELLKVREEKRNALKRETRKARFQKGANDEEEEFDSDAEEEAWEEGRFLTDKEREALLRGYDDEEEEDQSSIEDDDVDMDVDMDGEGELAPVDEERQGLREVIDREETVLEAVSDDDSDESEGESGDEDAEGSSQVDTQVDTQMETQLDTQVPGSDNDNEEEDEEVRVQRSRRAARSSQGATEIGGAASPVVQSGGAKTKYGRVHLGLEPTSGEHDEDDLLLLDEQDQVQTGPTQLETQLTSANDDDASLRAASAADEVSLMGETVATKSKSKKVRSTGNALYRLALEEEERRHRTRKGNSLMDDEAAEEEEEGLQAGLGDFGFGVTSNIREHDEEMNALKVRKGDFDNIVDDLSEDEGDEVAGDAARAQMELLEDRARDRAIITAVTEGHDAMRNRAKKGAFSFDKLVGDNALLADRRRRKGEEGGVEDAAVEEEELDEEELMQRGMQNRTDREKLSRARRGTSGGSDYDSDSTAPSDGEDDMFEQLDTSGMTEEEKVVEMERVQRLQAKNRQDALMAKQRIQSYKMARERARQEKIKRQQLEQQSQSQSQGLYHTSSLGSSSTLPGLSRQGSMGGAPRMARSLTLQPLEDEYSRILMLQRAESVSQPQLAAASAPSSSGSGSGSNLMPPPTISPRGVGSAAGTGVDGKLADITNVPQQQIKRRTTLVPKHAVGNDKRTMRRAQSTTPTSAFPSTSASASTGAQSNLYKGELNMKDVQEGYGMGMAVKKVDISGGIFSAVTGIRRIGDLAATKPHSFTSLKKRTFSETGKLGSTVAAQQFVFGAADEGSRMDSNSGFGSRSASVQGVKRPAGSAFQIPGGSLFAQLGAKRGRT